MRATIWLSTWGSKAAEHFGHGLQFRTSDRRGHQHDAEPCLGGEEGLEGVPPRFLDEPTNHLDIRYQREVLQLVRTLGVTTVVVLHDLNLAARYCDELVLLDGGRVVCSGTPEAEWPSLPASSARPPRGSPVLTLPLGPSTSLLRPAGEDTGSARSDQAVETRWWRTEGNRAKSRSRGATWQLCSVAMAAMTASGTRSPSAPASSQWWRRSARW